MQKSEMILVFKKKPANLKSLAGLDKFSKEKSGL
jgi:hypothetical protein